MQPSSAVRGLNPSPIQRRHHHPAAALKAQILEHRRTARAAMKSPVPDYLGAVLESVRPVNDGQTAQYIDVLAKADTSKLAVALATVDGTVYSAGDDDVEFSMQSISKPFVYAIAINDAGMEGVGRKIGVEPSGNAFNELSLKPGPGNKPYNAMVNVGAITAHSLVAGSTPEERCDRIVAVLSRLAGRQLSVDEEVYEAEFKDAHRNMGLGHMLKAAGILECSPEDAVRGYVRQCAIKVTVRDLAIMAATLANGGMQPRTGDAIISHPSVRQVLSVMTTCGMYDAAGDWLSNIGIPAKGGVSGGIICALPGQLGVATFSAKLDTVGNSVRGVAICEKLSGDMGLHMMDASQIARSTVKQKIVTVARVVVDGVVEGSKEDRATYAAVPIFELRGAVRFAGAELMTRTITRELSQPDAADPGSGSRQASPGVVFNLKNTLSLNAVAQRILCESVRRLRADGKMVMVIDPAEVLSTATLGPGEKPVHLKDVESALQYVGGAGYRIVSDHDES